RAGATGHGRPPARARRRSGRRGPAPRAAGAGLRRRRDGERAMIALAVTTLVLGQLHAWLAGHAGAALPDPYVLLVAFTGLHGPRRTLPLAILLLGWAHALTLAEPAGGHVLRAAAAVLLRASQRDGLDLRGGGVFLLGALVSALTLVSAGALLRGLSGQPLTAGWALITGAALALPLAAPARRLARRARRP